MGYQHSGPDERKEELERVIKYSYNTENEEWVREKIMVRFIESSPFAKGGMRVCFRVQEITEDQRNGDLVARGVQVAKMFMSKLPTEIHFDEAMSQTLAQDFAMEFNTLADQVGAKAKIRFLPVSVMKLLERGGQLVNVEPYLEGRYVKHNDNDGHVCTRDPVPQAFSHFTWEVSDGSLLICDIQGVEHYYTDPQIHSVDGEGFGGGNMGMPGIARFFKSHKCNGLCRAMGLTPVEVDDKGPQSPRRGQANSPPASVMQRRSQRIVKWDQLGLYAKGMQHAQNAVMDDTHTGIGRGRGPQHKLCSSLEYEMGAGSPTGGSPRGRIGTGLNSPGRMLAMSNRALDASEASHTIAESLRQLSMGSNESHLQSPGHMGRSPSNASSMGRPPSNNPPPGPLMHLIRNQADRYRRRSPSPQARGGLEPQGFPRLGSGGTHRESHDPSSPSGVIGFMKRTDSYGQRQEGVRVR